MKTAGPSVVAEQQSAEVEGATPGRRSRKGQNPQKKARREQAQLTGESKEQQQPSRQQQGSAMKQRTKGKRAAAAGCCNWHTGPIQSACKSANAFKCSIQMTYVRMSRIRILAASGELIGLLYCAWYCSRLQKAKLLFTDRTRVPLQVTSRTPDRRQNLAQSGKLPIWRVNTRSLKRRHQHQHQLQRAPGPSAGVQQEVTRRLKSPLLLTPRCRERQDHAPLQQPRPAAPRVGP